MNLDTQLYKDLYKTVRAGLQFLHSSILYMNKTVVDLVSLLIACSGVYVCINTVTMSYMS